MNGIDAGPYAAAAHAYRAAGWRGVLPLPAGDKWPPPAGFTGGRHADVWPSGADIQAWIDGPEGAGNIALRLPADVVGIDVDAYGDKAGAATLAELEERLGPLPPTWITTSRDDGISGIRLFRVDHGDVPPQRRRWKDEAGPAVEIVRHGHRYAIVAPSVVAPPKGTGQPYRWIYLPGGGQPARRGDGGVPRIEDLGELPAAWLEWIAPPLAPGEEPVGAAGEIGEGEARVWLAGCRDGAMCPPVEAVLREALGLLDSGRAGRHETARSASRSLTAFGGEGHAGVPLALTALRGGFLAAVAGDRRGGTAEAEAEWRRMLAGAVALARRAHPTPATRCGCRGWEVPAEWVPDPWAPPVAAGVPGEPPQNSLQAQASLEVATGGITATGAAPDARPALTPEMAALAAELLTTDTLDSIPDPDPLVEGFLALDTLATLIGKPGKGKSFVAVDLACCVATGRPWHGREVKQGPVLMLAAEGAVGVRQRIRAWERRHGVRAHGVHILPRALQVMGEEWPTLAWVARWLGAALVIGDTQARIAVGVEENSAKEMGELVDRLDKFRAAAGGPCVLLVHHTSKNASDDDGGRGSGAVKGAVNTELKVTKDGNQVTITTTKQKDMPEAPPVELILHPVDLGTDRRGRPVSSAVLLAASDGGEGNNPWAYPNPADVSLKWRDRVYGVVAEVFGRGHGGTREEIRSVAVEQYKIDRRRFHEAFNELIERGAIAQVEVHGRLTQRWKPTTARHPDGHPDGGADSPDSNPDGRVDSNPDTPALINMLEAA